jgi:hypothetical protein
MKSKLKYERPKLVELTSNEWNIGYGQGSPSQGCGNGNLPTPPACNFGQDVGK